jgi:hypothetical protein
MDTCHQTGRCSHAPFTWAALENSGVCEKHNFQLCSPKWFWNEAVLDVEYMLNLVWFLGCKTEKDKQRMKLAFLSALDPYLSLLKKILPRLEGTSSLLPFHLPLWKNIAIKNHPGSTEQPSPDMESSGLFTLDFPASRVVRKSISLLYKWSCLNYFVTAAQID